MDTIKENARHILKGLSTAAKYYTKTPANMTKYTRNGREYYIDNELAHYIEKAGYTAA